MNSTDKLQSRKLLRAARWGFDDLLANRREGREFVFFLVGIVTILRSVPYILVKHDRRLSPEHEKAIGAWEARMGNWRAIPELSFLKWARDALIKGRKLRRLRDKL